MHRPVGIAPEFRVLAPAGARGWRDRPDDRPAPGVGPVDPGTSGCVRVDRVVALVDPGRVVRLARRRAGGDGHARVGSAAPWGGADCAPAGHLDGSARLPCPGRRRHRPSDRRPGTHARHLDERPAGQPGGAGRRRGGRHRRRAEAGRHRRRRGLGPSGEPAAGECLPPSGGPSGKAWHRQARVRPGRSVRRTRPSGERSRMEHVPGAGGRRAAGARPPDSASWPGPRGGTRRRQLQRCARVILEADGRRWHTRIRDLAEDHVRDAEAARVGWETLRFVYEQIAEEPEEVCATVADVRAVRLGLLDPRLRPRLDHAGPIPVSAVGARQ